MAREDRIRVSEEEKQALDSVKQDMFGTKEVPYGAVITPLINHWRKTDGDQ